MTENKTHFAGLVRITKHEIPWINENWESLAETTSRRIVGVQLSVGLHYYNPEYSLFAPSGTPITLFVKQARLAQIRWNKKIARVLGAGTRRRAIKREHPLKRQLIFSGILFIEGKQIHPRGWPTTDED